MVFNYSSGKLASITGSEIPTVEYTYTGNNLTRATVKDTGGTLLTEKLYNYDDANNKITITDALGNTTDVIYTTTSGRRVSSITEKLTIDSVLQTLTTSYTYQPLTTGMVTTVTDPLNKITEYTTNNMGNVEKIIEDKGGLNITTQTEWDEQQNLVEQTEPKGAIDPNPAMYKTVLDYNEKGDVKRIVNPQSYSTTYDYNIKSDPTEVIDFGKKPNINNYDPSTRNLLAASDPLFSTNVMQYDAYGNVISQTNPIGIGGNIIINSGFENWSGSLPSSWSIYSAGGTVNDDTTEKVNGDHSVRLESPGNLQNQLTIILSDFIPVNESVRYNVSWYVKTLNAGPDNGGATADIHWYDQNKVWMGSQYVTVNAAPTIGTTDSFIRKGTQVSSPVNARYAKIALGLSGGPGSSAATAWFDDVQFELGSVINQYNLAYNAGFELDMDANDFPDGWTGTNLTAQDVLDATVTRSGTGRSLMINGSTADKSFSQEIELSGTVNTPIRFSGWSKAVGWSAGGTYRMKLEFYDDTTLLGSHVLDFPKTDSNWHFVDDVVMANNDFTKLKIYGMYENQTGTAWFDDFTVRLAEAPNALMSAYNISQNGSFEYDYNQTNWPDEWVKFNSATPGTYDFSWVPTSDAMEAYSGNYMIRIANVPDWAIAANAIIEPIKAGMTYTAGAVIKTNNVTGSGAVLKFDILDINGVYLSQKVSEIITGTRDWTRVVVTLSEAEAKAINSNAARIRVAVGTLGATGGEMYFDAVRVLEGDLLTKYTYDTNGNYITSVRNQLGYTINMVNDSRGNVTQITDAKNNITKFVYDKLDNIKQMENPKGLIPLYFYDKESNLTQIDNYKRTGPTTSEYLNTTIAIQYNEQLLPKRITDGNWRATYFEYNKNTQLKDVKFPNGKQIHYQYDAVSRLQTVTYTGDATQWSYGYDADSNMTSVVKNGTETTSYEYDNLDRMTKVTFPAVFGSTDNIQYIYNPNSQNLSTQYSKLPIASQQMIYEYDQAGANMIITGPNNTSAEFMYDEESRLKKSDIRNDVMKYNTYNDYDAAGRIIRLRSENKDGTPVLDWSCQYDANGNRTKDINNIAGKRVEYDYDAINQLIEERYYDVISGGTPTKRISYQYDLLGNRTQKAIEGGATTNYEYNAANEITNANGTPQYTHDYNGNMTDAYNYTFTYNAENQLIRIDLSGAEIARYEYDSKGLRTRKITPVRTDRYYYDGDDLAYVTEENSGTSENKLKYFFTRDTSGRLMHMIDYTAAEPETYFYILDIHDNVVALADETGNRVVNYEYDAWGNLTNTPETVTTGNGELLSNANPFRYSGYQFDPENGLYYLKARYYTAILGRFLTRDTLYELENGTLSVNQYVYCENNPIIYVDLTGHIANGWWNSTKNVGRVLDALIILISGGQAITGYYAAKAFLKKNKNKVIRQISGKILKMFGKPVAMGLSSAIDFALTIFGTSVGELIAKALDYADPWWGKRRNNGYIYG